MPRIFCDENNSCEIDFSAALWATDSLHDIFHQAKLSILCDVDFIAETEQEILFVEYKNANLPQAVHPEAFKPLDDKKLNTVARKYFDSLQFLQSMQHHMHKIKRYIYILECVNGDIVLRKRVRTLLTARLPFLLQQQIDMPEKMIDSVQVLSIEEWNQAYPDFRLQMK